MSHACAFRHIDTIKKFKPCIIKWKKAAEILGEWSEKENIQRAAVLQMKMFLYVKGQRRVHRLFELIRRG